MPDPVKAALDAAKVNATTARKIAAFLRALPPGWHMDKSREDIARAVEDAARGE